MSFSVTHRILGPIALLILIGAATTGWISREAVRTHDDLQSQEEMAYDLLFSVERAQDAFEALAGFASDVLTFNTVYPPEKLALEYGAMRTTLENELSHIGEIVGSPDLAGSVRSFKNAVDAWSDAAEIAIGLERQNNVPAPYTLTRLRNEADTALVAIYAAARAGAAEETSRKRQEYKSRVDAIFYSLLAVFAVFGLFFLGFGRRLARSLTRIAESMENIRKGDFKPDIVQAHGTDEIGKITQGVQAFGETLQALTQANEKVKHLAMHDQLTGLCNRRALEEKLETLVAEAGGRALDVALFHIDLDRFKQVNDMFGHAAGDDILKHASHAMETHKRKDDFVARIGGDEFVIVLHGVNSKEAAASAAKRIIDAVSEPIEVQHDLVNVGASIGIAFMDTCGSDIERWLANADMALYIAKGAGRGRYSFYSEETRDQFESDMSMLRELRNGLERGEIIAYFQPKVDAASNQLIGFEALARWAHPKKGILGPGTFLDLAFNNGLGDRLSDIIVREAINALRGWRNNGLDVPSVSINFSAKQLRDNNLPEYLDDALLMAGLLPKDIVVEVLESVFFGDDVDPAHATIAQLKRRGYRIELDDFGTGHASISNLRKFKVDGVKLDRIFVTGVDTDPEQELIMRTLIDLCRNLDINCLAEGVETEAERTKLLSLGCSQIQGFGIAKPMSREDVTDWVKSHDVPKGRPEAV